MSDKKKLEFLTTPELEALYRSASETERLAIANELAARGQPVPVVEPGQASLFGWKGNAP